MGFILILASSSLYLYNFLYALSPTLIISKTLTSRVSLIRYNRDGMKFCCSYLVHPIAIVASLGVSLFSLLANEIAANISGYEGL
jgi:hypothetical protein